MMSTQHRLEYRRLRAPSQHGGVLTEPSPKEAAGLIAQNRQWLLHAPIELAGVTLRELQNAARHDLLRQAASYTRNYRDLQLPAELPPCPSLLVAGHQPELFHAGVWFKNFLLARLGHEHQVPIVNLLIDNDVLSSPSIRVPTGSIDRPHLQTVLFDRPGPQVPYEERRLEDRACFDGFGEQVQRSLEPLISQPLVRPLWDEARQLSGQFENLGCCVAAARHRLEQRWGLQTAELPLSAVCRTPWFAWFTATLLDQHDRLHSLYNHSLHEYRRANRLRSRSHPAADLATEDGWVEAPFWVWSAERPWRRRLFVKPHNRWLQLTDRSGWTFDLPRPQSAAMHEIADAWHRIEHSGYRVRPRALITTMYCRLVLGDLFVHGIGGAKYDQLTDGIMQQLFGIDPPGYMVATATLRLPLELADVSEQDVRTVQQQLRELRFHPELYANGRPEAEPIIREKRRWIAAHPPRGSRRERHVGIERANEQLQPLVQPLREQLLAERESLQEKLRHRTLLGSREMPFCLFPEPQLPDLLVRLAENHE